MMLLGGSMWPITDTIGFVKAACADVAGEFVRGRAPELREDRVSLDVRDVQGDLRAILENLLPLTDIDARRYLFVPTRGPWTAFFDNGFRGTDTFPEISRQAEHLKSLALRVTCAENRARRVDSVVRGRLGAVILEVWGPEQTDWLNLVRSISAMNEGPRWSWEETGKVLPFEETERYSARRIRDRFTPELLDRYLRAMDIRAFAEDFYAPSGTALLVEKRGPAPRKMEEFTLEEARARGWGEI